jgi:hypothetical protein
MLACELSQKQSLTVVRSEPQLQVIRMGLLALFQLSIQTWEIQTSPCFSVKSAFNGEKPRRRHMRKYMCYAMVKMLTIIGGFICLFSMNAFGTIIYIPDAYPTIQQGIDAAFAGDTIIVRDGTYLLAAALDFKGKAITVISEKGVSNCILDGQNLTRIAYFHSGETGTSILSGFTIQNGIADKGGAIYCEESSPTITQCTIRRNNANAEPGQGGAICLKSSSASITYCQISDNTVSGTYTSYGGGIYSSASSPNISNCTISGNTAATSGCCGLASYGGGAYIEGGSPVISGVSIVGNTSSASSLFSYQPYGGGIYFKSSSPFISNSIIRNNSTSANSDSYGGGVFAQSSFLSAENLIINSNSSNRGAGIYLDSSFANLTNCTILRNIAALEGGGLYCANSSPQVVNCILWEDIPAEILTSGSGNPTVTYSDVLGGYAGTGNLNSNPLFVNIAGQDFHLTAASPCINAGNNGAPYLPTKDMDGQPRIWNGTVDMGAYEYQSCALPAIVTLISPSATTTTATPTYTFNAVSNATSYFLWVNDSTGVKITQWYTAAQAGCPSGSGTCSVTPQVALAGGTARWWVQAMNVCGYGPWSDVAVFTAGAAPGVATLVSPSGLGISSTPTYIWNAVPAADYYLLLVTDHTSSPRIQTWYSASQAGCGGGTGICSAAPFIGLVPGDAQWFIQTYNENGYGPWSAGMGFTVTGTVGPGKAVLVSPIGSISTATPTYSWNAVSSVSWYLLYVQDSTDFAGRVVAWLTAAQAGCAAGTGICSFTPNSALAMGAARWWIQTRNDLGTGPWSDAMSFSVQSGAPGKATLVSPTGATATKTPTYTWNAVVTATWYRLWVNDNSGPKIDVWYTAAQAGCAAGTGNCAVTPGTQLASGAAEWWIQTWNDYGYGPWSDGMSFTVTVLGPSASAVPLLRASPFMPDAFPVLAAGSWSGPPALPPALRWHLGPYQLLRERRLLLPDGN